MLFTKSFGVKLMVILIGAFVVVATQPDSIRERSELFLPAVLCIVSKVPKTSFKFEFKDLSVLDSVWTEF
jgi:hypothetical protein